MYELSPERKIQHERIEAENKQLTRALTCYELYKTDKNVSKALEIMEKILIYDDIVVWTPRYMHFLVELYIKSNLNNKAWWYLNQLITKPLLARAGDVYLEMAWMLKKEKKHSDAIECFMMGYIDKARQGEFFNKANLIKDIGVPVRALKWSSEMQEHIANICEQQILSQQFNISQMTKQYRDYLKSCNQL